MEARYGQRIGLLYGIYAIIFLMINMSAMQNGAAKVVSAATGGAIPHGWVVWSMTIIFIAYSFLGGRISAAVTDVLQSLLIIVLSFLIIPFGLAKLGGFQAFKATLSPEQLSLAIPGGLTFGLIFVLSVQSIFSIFAQPQQMAAVGTGKTEINCRVGFTYGNIFMYSLGGSILGLIVGSLMTRPEPESHWRDIQERLHTPVSAETGSPHELRARAESAEANGEGLLIADVTRLHRTFSYRRYRVDITGALTAFAVVGLLIALAYFIARV